MSATVTSLTAEQEALNLDFPVLPWLSELRLALERAEDFVGGSAALAGRRKPPELCLSSPGATSSKEPSGVVTGEQG